MKNLTPDRARELQASGVTHIASVVKSVFRTTYYHVNSISEIMDNGGRWIPCPQGQCGSWHGRIGIRASQIDWRVTRSTDFI